MIRRVFRKILRRPAAPPADAAVADKAGAYFDSGCNCTESVLRAVLGEIDPQMTEIAEAFGAGVGGSKCLCGAVTGGVIALSLKGKKQLAGKLVARFKETNKVTCCKALSAPYRWKSPEHLANCRRLTVETAAEVERLLKG